MVVPEAIKVLRLKSDHTFTLLGTLSKEVGWGYTELVNRLETQRKIKEQAYYAEKFTSMKAECKPAREVKLGTPTNIRVTHDVVPG